MSAGYIFTRNANHLRNYHLRKVLSFTTSREQYTSILFGDLLIVRVQMSTHLNLGTMLTSKVSTLTLDWSSTLNNNYWGTLCWMWLQDNALNQSDASVKLMIFSARPYAPATTNYAIQRFLLVKIMYFMLIYCLSYLIVYCSSLLM